MAINSGRSSVTLREILDKATEADILLHYLGVTRVPCIINSPMREDKNPSFGLYSPDGNRIFWTDFSTKDRGGLFDLLSNMWGVGYREVLERVYEDIPKFKAGSSIRCDAGGVKVTSNKCRASDLQCRVREWRRYDIKYWESYGISLEWLKRAEVYPISHKIITKGGQRYVFGADKYAYAYVEHKEGKVTLKIYQPFNKNGFKWLSKHNTSVISLWTKVPEYGERICICASLKDALCLWANTGIPSVATQGEGYNMSNTAVEELKRRFKKVYILFDNDEAGIADGRKLANDTGFINLVLPKTDKGKDVSDIYYYYGKEYLCNMISEIIQEAEKEMN